jgi:hypothetical protein
MRSFSDGAEKCLEDHTSIKIDVSMTQTTRPMKKSGCEMISCRFEVWGYQCHSSVNIPGCL